MRCKGPHCRSPVHLIQGRRGLVDKAAVRAGWLRAVAVMIGVTLLVPFVQRIFRFGPLHADDLAVTVGAGLLAIIILEVLKPHWRKRLVT